MKNQFEVAEEWALDTMEEFKIILSIPDDQLSQDSRNKAGTLWLNLLSLIETSQVLSDKLVRAYKFETQSKSSHDEYDKDAIKAILVSRDKMSEEDAQALIIEFEEEIKQMSEDNASMSDIEDTFTEYFSLEPDYLFCFLNV